MLNYVNPMPGTNHARKDILNLRPGEIVEVRDENEILATLDDKGTFEALPFMPIMRGYCGKRFKVLRRADKIIAEGFGMRHMRNTVILEGATCDGEAQGKCRKTCLILWKEVWLRRAGESKRNTQTLNDQRTPIDLKGQPALRSGILCQSRSLMEASSPLPRWDIRRYLWDFTSGVYEPSEWIRTMIASVLLRMRIILGREGRNKFRGDLRRTPAISLDLRPGDFVKIKTKEEIQRTLDRLGRNRGLEFTPEMEKYCGKTFQVLKRLDRMITDQGVMRQISNTVLLEGVTCDGKAHGGCPRNCFCLWREIWLERMNKPDV